VDRHACEGEELDEDGIRAFDAVDLSREPASVTNAG